MNKVHNYNLGSILLDDGSVPIYLDLLETFLFTLFKLAGW